MKSAQKIEGRWWIFGQRKGPHYGILNFDPDSGLTLTIKIARPGQSTLLFDRKIRSKGVPQVIRGLDSHDRPVTLFGCSPPSTSGSSGFAEITTRAFYCVTEGHWKSIDDVLSKRTQIELSLLNNWTGHRAIRELPGTGLYRPIGVTIPNDIIVPLDHGVTLTIKGFVGTRSSFSEYQFNQTHYAIFDFPEPLAFKKINSEYLLVLRRLLTLLTGRLVYIDKILLVGDSVFSQQVLFSNQGVTKADRETLSFHMLAPMSELGGNVVHTIQRWFQYHRKLDSVLSLYFATIQNQHLYSNHVFLFLAQALEVYHSTNSTFLSSVVPASQFRSRVNALTSGLPKADQAWLKQSLQHANQKTLAQRLEDILVLNKSETARLVPNPSKFADLVRHTRNYYTHYRSSLKKSGKIAEGVALMKLNRQMRALIEICILKDLGISGPPVEKVISDFKAITYRKA